MSRMLNYSTTLVIVISLINGYQCGEKCACQLSSSPIIMRQPKRLSECSSDDLFKQQIDHNYEIMFEDLQKSSCSCNEKDLAEFRKLLNVMKEKIVGIVDSYFQCHKNKDPTDGINGAIASYDLIRKRFRTYGRNAFNNLSSNCNSVIQNIRRLPYISAENTITSIVTCAKLKL